MRITGLEFLVFGVDDLAGAVEFCTDAGLTGTSMDGQNGGFFVAQDGTGLEIRPRNHPSLPPVLASGSMTRQFVFGVEDEKALDEIAAELKKDRDVVRDAKGAVLAQDAVGLHLKFQLSLRKPIDLPTEKVNAPGATVERPVNVRGADPDVVVRPRCLSHCAIFVPDADAQEQFYTKRLGFRVTDRLLGAGMFVRPSLYDEHHTTFFINTPPHMMGLEHFAFHVQGPTELMHWGWRLANQGYQSAWGPGRHWFGSNWFWYFNSPMGARFECDADMDKVDDKWEVRSVPFSADAAQMFLFEKTEKWLPSG